MREESTSVESTVTHEALRRYFPQEWSLRRAIIPLPDHATIYVKNPKAACSTITLWLDRIHTGDHTFTTPRVHKENRLPRPQQVGWDRVGAMLAGAAFRFTFVRNPLARAESCWIRKIQRSTKYRPQLQAVLGLPEDPSSPLTFEQFVTALEVQDPMGMDRHWRPQHLNLMHPLVEYDHIGHLETFDRDLAIVRERAGLPDAPLDVVGRTARSGASEYDGRPDLVRRVEAIYAKDFELYGY